MKIRDFGISGMKFTSIGLGTWNMEAAPRDSALALRAGLEEGANHIDTAELYGEGRVEDIVAQAIRGLRNKIRLVSKVMPSNASYESTLKSCEASLRRLETDHLDIYLLHWREKNTPIEETFRAFEKLKEQGKILGWGVSNFDIKDLEEAERQMGKGKIVCNQVLYHLKERSIEFEVIPWCKAHGIAVMGYSPLQQGSLPESPALKKISQRLGSTLAQVTLAYLTRDPALFAIPKSSTIKRAMENVRAMDLELSEKDIAEISSSFPPKAKKTLAMI